MNRQNVPDNAAEHLVCSPELSLNSNLQNRNAKEIRRAVFLDRDGVLCEDTDFVTSFEKLHIFPFARAAIEQIHKKGYFAIVISNQSGVARGFMTKKTVQAINDFIRQETGVDAMYYCPHLPPEGAPVLPYRIICDCRKPKPGMILQAAAEFQICLEHSFMVGDRPSDLEAGRRAGVRVVAISDSKGLFGNAKVFPDILHFAEWLPEEPGETDIGR